MHIKNKMLMRGFLSILIFILSGCGGNQQVPSSATALFSETESTGEIVTAPQIVRSRFVRINFGLLINDAEQSSRLKTNSEITLNIFPDVNYVGVIDHVEKNGDDYTWTGHLKGIEFSALTMVVTGGIFIGHFSSPNGVYEVSSAGEDLYQAVMIDQTKLGGDD